MNSLILADDFEDFLDVCELALSSKGFEVKTAKDGMAALELYKQEQQRIDLIVSDVNMPRMNGIDFFHETRKIFPHVPFVFVTGHAQNFSQELERVSELPGVRVLEKPFDFDVLVKTVEELVENREAS